MFFGQVNGFQLSIGHGRRVCATTVNFNGQEFVVGQQENVSATVSVTNTGAAVTAGTITFTATDESATLPQVSSPPLSLSSFFSGQAFYNFGSSLVPGQWLVNASYTGDSGAREQQCVGLCHSGNGNRSAVYGWLCLSSPSTFCGHWQRDRYIQRQ